MQPGSALTRALPVLLLALLSRLPTLPATRAPRPSLRMPAAPRPVPPTSASLRSLVGETAKIR